MTAVDPRPMGARPPPVATPPSLAIVSGVFVVLGVVALVGMLATTSRTHVTIDLNVCCFAIGIGLIYRRPLWRLLALIYLAVTVVLLTIAVVLASSVLMIAHYSFLHLLVGSSDKPGALMTIPGLAGIGYYLLLGWCFWVLTRSPIRALFHP